MADREDLRREIAFDDWISRIPTRMLECRVNRHAFADWSDKKRAAWRKSRATRIVSVEVPCKRRCGTTLTKFMENDGTFSRRNIIRHFYDPEFGYLMPPEARGPGLTKERIAKFRQELMERNEPSFEYDE
jgi:hypothetical protein